MHTLQFLEPNAIDEGTLRGEALFPLAGREKQKEPVAGCKIQEIHTRTVPVFILIF